jgi:hypothetical protein
MHYVDYPIEYFYIDWVKVLTDSWGSLQFYEVEQML